MNNMIEVKTTTTTTMKIKKATIVDDVLYVEGEPIDMMSLLSNTFGGSIFDISVTEKVEVEN